MRVEKEFTVAAPLEEAWSRLLDAETLAACLPGAEFSRIAGEDAYSGAMTVAANGTKVAVKGSLKAIDADEDDRVASILLQGRESGGPAIGVGTLEGRLAPAGGSTRVALSADLRLTGQRASGDAVEKAAAKVLEDFAGRLEQRILEGGAPAPQAEAAAQAQAPRAAQPAVAAAAEPQPAATGRGAELADDSEGGPLADLLGNRGAAAGIAGLLLLVLALLAGRSKKRATFAVSYRW